MDNNTYSVYQHIFPNGMIYTGLTHLVPVEKRFGKNGRRYNGNKTLWTAICKFGWENIMHIVVKNNLSMKEAQKLEQQLILETKEKDISYNTLSGGDIGGSSYLMFEYNGEVMSLKDIYDKYHKGNVTKTQFYTRVLHHHWDLDRALTQSNTTKVQPFGVGKKTFEYNGKMYNSYELWQLRKSDDITQYEIVNRINHHGWSVEDAITKPMKKYGVLYEYKGKMYNTEELANLYPENNLKRSDITGRLRNGWSVEKTVETPKQTKKKYCYNNKMMTIKEIYNLFDEPKVGYTTFFSRFKQGIPPEEAIKYHNV